MADRIVVVGVIGGATAVDHDPVHVCRHEGDQVVWRGVQNFDIDFGALTPFAQATFHGGPRRPAQSGPVVGAFGRYKYTVQVVGAAPFDPSVDTDP